MAREFKPGRALYMAMIVGGGIGMLVGVVTDLPMGLCVGIGTGVGAIIGMRKPSPS